MLNCFTDYSFNITHYSLIIKIILMIKTYGVLQEQYTLNLALGKSKSSVEQRTTDSWLE